MSQRGRQAGVPQRQYSAGRAAAAVSLAVAAVAGCGGGTSGASGRATSSAPAPAPATSAPGVVPPAPPSALPTRSPAASPSAAPPVGPRDLVGATIVLDAGHNGGNGAQRARLAALVPAGGYTKACNTTGTQTDAGYPEHAFTFDVVSRAAALLRARGATVVLTRSSDAGFGPCVDQRAAIANGARADAVVSVHADGGPPSGRGFHVIAPALAPDRGNAEVLDAGYTLALALRSGFRSATGEPYATYTAQEGLARRSDLAGLTLARVPTVFVECANMRNAQDAALVTSADWRARAAAGVAGGAASFVTGR